MESEKEKKTGRAKEVRSVCQQINKMSNQNGKDTTVKEKRIIDKKFGEYLLYAAKN